jgi:protein tyrosine/serine phosphatase
LKKIFFLILIIVLFGSSHCLAGKNACDKNISLSKEISNFHIVSPYIMRGGQPTEEGFRQLKNCFGVKTILSLRNNQQHNAWEETMVEAMGMNFINVPMDGTKEQSIETIEQCLDIINDEVNQPVFVHCHSGSNRTGLIFAAYRIKYDNWSLNAALMEMLAYGCNPTRNFRLERALIKWNDWNKNHSKKVQAQSF